MRSFLKLSVLAVAATLTASAAFAENDSSIGTQTPLQFQQSQPANMVYGQTGSVAMARGFHQSRMSAPSTSAYSSVDRAVGSPNAGN